MDLQDVAVCESEPFHVEDRHPLKLTAQEGVRGIKAVPLLHFTSNGRCVGVCCRLFCLRSLEQTCALCDSDVVSWLSLFPNVAHPENSRKQPNELHGSIWFHLHFEFS